MALVWFGQLVSFYLLALLCSVAHIAGRVQKEGLKRPVSGASFSVASLCTPSWISQVTRGSLPVVTPYWPREWGN